MSRKDEICSMTGRLHRFEALRQVNLPLQDFIQVLFSCVDCNYKRWQKVAKSALIKKQYES